jgi:hypothetical protein
LGETLLGYGWSPWIIIACDFSAEMLFEKRRLRVSSPAVVRRRKRRDFWEICEDRYQARSLILTSQLPVSRWREQVGDPTVADGILDRIVHNAHRIEMRGDSMRKNRGEKPSR